MSAPFSVLLPVWRGDDAAFFTRAVESVTFDQTLPPSQVVIVADGPLPQAIDRAVDTVCSRLAAAKPPIRCDVVRLPTNRGLAGALTAGLAACEFDIVARMDADDISEPERFARQVPLVADGLDIVGSAIREFTDEPDTGGLVRVPPLTAHDIAVSSRFTQPFNHPSVVYRRSAVEAAGGYQDLPLMEDYWLFARMILAGATCANVADPLVRYRIGAGAYARRGGRSMLRSELELQRKFHQAGFTTRAQWLRNVAIRGAYRLVPESVRRAAYRARTRVQRHAI